METIFTVKINMDCGKCIIENEDTMAAIYPCACNPIQSVDEVAYQVGEAVKDYLHGLLP